MKWVLGIAAFFCPRLVIVLLVLFSDYIGEACKTVIWPFLGFLFAPVTTLAYAFSIHENGSVSGLYVVLVVVAALIDLGIIGGGAKRRSKKPAST